MKYTLDLDNKGLIETIEFHQEEIKRIDKWIAKKKRNRRFRKNV